jgi:streptomycin 6-kinase
VNTGFLALMFSEYLQRWELTPDGEPIVTPTGGLLPVQWAGVPAMLKIAFAEEERRGANLMVWWDGKGAARVLAHEQNALLMERAESGPSLSHLAHNGRDDEASRTMCSVLAQLHASRDNPPPALVPLTEWFDALGQAAEQHGGILCAAARTATSLLATQRETVVLHGDMHHGNMLRFRFQDGGSPDGALEIAELAAVELGC